MLSSAPSASCNLVTGGESVLNADGCRLVRVLTAEGWRGCGNFLNTTMKFAASTDSFMNDFSVACDSV